jgi:hypothetical protein
VAAAGSWRLNDLPRPGTTPSSVSVRLGSIRLGEGDKFRVAGVFLVVLTRPPAPAGTLAAPARYFRAHQKPETTEHRTGLDMQDKPPLSCARHSLAHAFRTRISS